MAFLSNLGWLLVFVASCAVPLVLDAHNPSWLTYFSSLVIWLIPISYLWPYFLHVTDPGQRRRKALAAAIAAVVVLGSLLDFLLGPRALVFTSHYVWCIRGVPVEELLFYALAPIAITLTYACCDEVWFHSDALEQERHSLTLADPLIGLNRGFAIIAVILVFVDLAVSIHKSHVLIYFTFLIVCAILPAVALYSALRGVINWPAFAATTLYVIATSMFWELTLALPRGWWGYQMERMLVPIGAWRSIAPFPIEAAIVWVCAPFTCVLIFEFVRALLYHPAPTVRAALFGPGHHAPSPPRPPTAPKQSQ